MNKRIFKVNKFIALLLSIVMLFVIAGCGNQDDTPKADGELYSKAIEYLDELGDEPCIEDFRSAYNLLTTLPNEKNKFISQLEKVEQIFSKYNVELDSGSYYLTTNVNITDESIVKYKSKGAYYDATDLLESIVYPVLFEKYGDNAHCIEGLTYNEVISAIKSTSDYTFNEKKEQFDNCREIWEFIGTPKSKYEIKYHSNGLVQSVDIPIVRSVDPMSDSDYVSFLENDKDTQKTIAGSRFVSMQNQFTTITTGYEVLSQIFNDEEITIISNYIRSLSADDIWKKNFLDYGGESAAYTGAYIIFDYNGKHISVNYGLNDIILSVSGSNDVNPLSHRWYTLWCGLCMTDSQETVIKYTDYINNNTSYNNTVQDYSFDLSANAEQFKKLPTADLGQTDANNTQQSDVQQSIPVEMSMSEKLTTYGTIEKNDTDFPAYRLKLTTKLSILFDEYIGEKVFECEYLYFYDDKDLNGNYPLEDFVGETCEVTALLEDYRGGNELFMLNPVIKMN